MHNRSKKLKRKIRTCAGLTGSGTLIAAATLGLVSKGYGEIVYLQLDDHISPNSQLGYDIDGDGNIDVNFMTGNGSLWGLPFAGASMRAEYHMLSGCTFGVCGTVVRYDSLGYSLALPHQAGELIYGSFQDLCYTPGDNPAWLALGSSGPFFEPTSPRYAGFSFVTVAPETLSYNAWAELEVTEPRPGEYELDVIAIGYETEPFVGIEAGHTFTGITENISPTRGLALNNTPNPFNAQTQIEFQLPSTGTATIQIYNAAGRLVRTITYKHAQQGMNSVNWNGYNDSGRRVPSGVYFCRLEALGITQTRKMIIIE